ncbi:MAG: aldo/keto reductase [Alphaproteobacteria bacterium]|nr:aldo/keto reductase [Alphaproteobacteria bacterium]
MKTRTLGPEGLAVSAIGYGAPTFSGRVPPGGIANACAVVARAIDLGVTLIDTADHGDGNNEDVLALALAGKRDKVVLCSKFGNLRGWSWSKDSGRTVDGSPAYARKALEGSLKRLKTDYLDLYYLHRVDPAVPIEESIGAMVRLKEEGKIRHIGICEAGAETIRRAARVHPIAAIQSEYNLMTRDYEDATIPEVKEIGIGFVAYYPLARGFFAGAITRPPADGRKAVPRFSAENLPGNLVLLTRLRMMAEVRGCSVGQLALAWLLHKGEFIVPIPGTNSIAHLEENCAAADVTLSAPEMAKIDRIFARDKVKGARFDRDRSGELNI